MSLEFPNLGHAMAVVPAGGATFTLNAGFASIANGGTGLNNLTLSQEVDSAQSVIVATPVSATADCSCQVVHTSDAVKQVRTYIAGTLSDAVAFNVFVFHAPQQ